MPIIPGQHPNEAYELALSPESLRMPGWYTVTCNGIPVYHFAPQNVWDAERYCFDPEYLPGPDEGQALGAQKQMTSLRCYGTHCLCEAHPHMAWEGEYACGCGAPGMPCPICNASDGVTPPKMPPGFVEDESA
jgi:hypothetical protein